MDQQGLLIVQRHHAQAVADELSQPLALYLRRIFAVVPAQRGECVEGFSKLLLSRKVKISVPFSKA